MDGFNLRGALIGDYQSLVRGFVHVAAVASGAKWRGWTRGCCGRGPLVQLDAAVESRASSTI